MAGEVVFGGFMIFFMLIWAGMMILGLLGLILWIFMLVDLIKRNFKNDNDKILWILILVLTGIIGAVIYYFVIKKPNRH